MLVRITQGILKFYSRFDANRPTRQKTRYKSNSTSSGRRNIDSTKESLLSKNRLYLIHKFGSNFRTPNKRYRYTNLSI